MSVVVFHHCVVTFYIYDILCWQLFLLFISDEWTVQNCIFSFYIICVSFVGKYCGHTKPKPMVSLTNQLTVYFDSNDETAGRGFKAHYRAVDPELTSGKRMSGKSFQQENCLDSGIMLNVYLTVYDWPRKLMEEWVLDQLRGRWRGMRIGWVGGSGGVHPWGVCEAEVPFLHPCFQK